MFGFGGKAGVGVVGVSGGAKGGAREEDVYSMYVVYAVDDSEHSA